MNFMQQSFLLGNNPKERHKLLNTRIVRKSLQKQDNLHSQDVNNLLYWLQYTNCELYDTLQRHNTENSKQIFPEKKLRCLIPNFHIHVSVSNLYSHNRSAYSAAGKYVDRSWEYINCSQTHECGNWD
jgi:hypothetical protein